MPFSMHFGACDPGLTLPDHSRSGTTYCLSLESAGTLDNPYTCVYRKRDIERLGRELDRMGFTLSPVNFNCGKQPVDEYVDLPPFRTSPHLKLELEGHTVTSLGLLIHRG